MIRLCPFVCKWTRVVNTSQPFQQASHSSATSLQQATVDSNNDLSRSNTEEVSKKVKQNERSTLVESVFANLSFEAKSNSGQKRFLTSLDKKIEAASNINELLNIASQQGLSRQSYLKIISILGDWAADKKILLSDFEKDERFIKMCRILGKGLKSNWKISHNDVINNSANDDEAAKRINSIPVHQMVKVLSQLAVTKKRSTPILQSLAFNMSKNEDKLTVKQCADVLFAMASLRFHDEVLLVKICADALCAVPSTLKSVVIGSIARSLGILRYKDSELLDSLSEWVVKNHQVCRPNDVAALIMTLALVNYQPNNSAELFQAVLPHIKLMELPSTVDFLDAVWSLVLLNYTSSDHVAAVLSPEFISKLKTAQGDQLLHSTVLKLLNINGAAQILMKSYTGPLLDKKQFSDVTFTKSKDKLVLVSCVMDTLSNLLPSDTYLKKNVDSRAGFIIDGECLVDAKCTPLRVDSKTRDGIRIAIMVLDYNDTCLGTRSEPNGVFAFSERILESSGYRVVKIPHSEFSPKSKLVARVQYLEQRLKSVVAT